MYKAIFFTILLVAVELARAIPTPMRVVVNANNGSDAEKKNIKDAEKDDERTIILFRCLANA